MKKVCSPAQRAKTSRAMKKYWAHRRAEDQHRALVHEATKGFVQKVRDHDRDMVEVVPKPIITMPERFPFMSYASVLTECEQIVHDRDQQARNTYKPFAEQFPHGVQDVTFELHRRVLRILGAEKAITNGHHGAFNDPQAKELVETMRADALDLVNYAAFAVLLLDQATQGGA